MKAEVYSSICCIEIETDVELEQGEFYIDFQFLPKQQKEKNKIVKAYPNGKEISVRRKNSTTGFS